MTRKEFYPLELKCSFQLSLDLVIESEPEVNLLVPLLIIIFMLP